MTPSELRARLRDLSGGEPDPELGDLRIDERNPAEPVRAAVLVPLLLGRDAGVLLTKRTSHLSSHGGQVAFPGGRVDPEDASAEHAALREAREEIGLRTDLVEVLGRLPDYLTGTNYRITPVVGLLKPGLSVDELALVPSPHEVESVLTLKLSVLLDPLAPMRKQRVWRGRDRHYWEWPHDEHHIWGATAAILVALAGRLRGQG